MKRCDVETGLKMKQRADLEAKPAAVGKLLRLTA
jgi:hypothetical protein